MILAWLVASMLLLMLIRVPVAICMLAPCLVYVVFSTDISLGVALQRTMAGINSFPLLAVPLFVLTGYLSNSLGLTDRLFRMLTVVLSRIPGSLAYVNVISSLMFSWMSGAAVADAAGLGSVMVPAMKKRGYDEGFALGITGASSLIGPIMPPSIPAIIYAVSAGVSVGSLFIASVIPALFLTAILCVSVFLYVRRNPIQNTIDPQSATTISAIADAGPVFLVPLTILGGILGGVFTPTEAAAAAVMMVLLLGCLFRSLHLQNFIESLQKTAITSGTILLVVAAAGLFAWIIAREQGPQVVAEALTRITDNRWMFLVLLNICLLLIGMLLEPVAALVITVPILLPMAVQYQIDPLHLGVVMILNLVIGLLTPPVGLVLYVLGSVTATPVHRVIRGTLPLLLPLMVALAIVTFFPAICLWLPNRLR